jgi:hypothetical protein
MQRPPSVQRFEQVYLASIALSLLGWFIDWPLLQARLAEDPRTAHFGWMLTVMLVLSIAVPVLLWFFAARRASGTAKWIVTILAALSVVRLLIDLPALLGGTMALRSFALGAATTAANVWAAALLFRPDARAWFEQDVVGEVE